MKRKVEIKRAIQGQILNAVWHGAAFWEAAKLAGIRPRVLRKYRKAHRDFDVRLRKLRENNRRKK